MAAYYPNNVTTDHIQQYLDENKSLILKIVDSQNSGKMNECAENQARLQRNLMYLAAIADSQPPNMNSVLYPPGGIMYQQAGTVQYQQAQQMTQQMTQQSLMAATRSSGMFYSQQPYPALQQQQLGMSSGGTSSLHILQGEIHNGGSSGGGGGGSLGIGFSDYGHDTSSSEGRGSKHDIGSFLSVQARGGSSSGDGGETMYMKSAYRDGN